MFIELVPPTNAPSAQEFGDVVMDALQRSLNPIAEVLKEEVDQRFETQSDPTGRAWAPLKEKTLLARARRTRANRILIVTSMLRNSFATAVDRARLRVTIAPGGPAAIYAPTQQFGRGPIPARAMLPDGRSVPRRTVDEIKATVEDAFKLAFAQFRARRP